MRKFNYYMAAFVFAAGVSASLTSCIDTEEPDGIKELRSAKAGYIQAETALKNADAAHREAEVENQKALNALQLINNRIAEVNAKRAELDLALREATQEDSVAIATNKAKKALEDAVLALKQTISNNEVSLKRTYRQNAEETAELLAFGDGELRTAYEQMVTDQDTYDDALVELADAQKDLAKALARYTADDVADFQTDIAIAEIEITTSEQNKKDFNDLLANPDQKAWKNKIDELQAEVDASAAEMNNLEFEYDALDYDIQNLQDSIDNLNDEYEAPRLAYENGKFEAGEIRYEIANAALLTEVKTKFASDKFWEVVDENVLTNKKAFYYKNIDSDTVNVAKDWFKGQYVKSQVDLDEQIKHKEKDIELGLDYTSPKGNSYAEDVEHSNPSSTKADSYYVIWKKAVDAYEAAGKDDRATKLTELAAANADLFGASAPIFYTFPSSIAMLGFAESDNVNTWDDVFNHTSNKYKGTYFAVKAYQYKLQVKLSAKWAAGKTVYTQLDDLKTNYDTEVANLQQAEDDLKAGEKMKAFEDKKAEKQAAQDKIQPRKDMLTALYDANTGQVPALISTLQGFLETMDGYDADGNADTFDLDDDEIATKVAQTNAWLDNKIAKAKAKKARAEYNQQLFENGDYAEALSLDITDAQTALETAQDAVDAAKKDLDKSTATYEAIKAKFVAE